MAKNMTFSVSLKLLTKNFQNGIKSIQNSLGKLRQQISTFVGGIGLGLGIQELIENAKSLDKAQATLRNVSNGVEGYGENLKFVQGLSKKYNQDLITLTGNFAKFHSAAAYANISLEDQQHIYESLTRASAYFNLTADETNGVMLAIQQMISKGRVSSEELRRQLGERLPGAMNLAAKAAGKAGITANGTTAELEDMIKEGKVLAVDLLPALATELNELTKNLDVNTIQGLTNQLKNAFTDLVEKLNVGGIYKKFLSALAGGLEYLGENLKSVAQAISIVLGTLVGKNLIEGGVKSWEKFFDKINTNLTKTQTQMKIFKKELDDLAKNKGVKYDVAQDGTISLDPAKNGNVMIADFDEAEEHVKNYNRELKKSNALQDQLNHKTKTMGLAIWENIKKLAAAAALQAAYYAIAAAISTIITKLVSWYKEQKRIRNLVADTNAEFYKVSNTLGVDETELQALQKSLNVENERVNAINRINKLLGLEGDAALTVADSNDAINKKIEERLRLLKQEREYQEAKRILTDAENRKKELEDRNVALKAADDANLGRKMGKVSGGGSIGAQLLIGAIADNSIESEYERNKKEISKLNEVISEYTKIVQKYGLNEDERNKILNPEFTGPDPTLGDGDSLEKQYQKIQNEHNNKLRALNQRLDDKVISQDDYDKAVKDLYFSTLESIYGLNDINENTDPFAKAIKDAVKVYLSEVESLQETEAAIKEYKKKVREAKNQFANGAITQKELDEKLFDLLKEVVTTIGSFSALSGAAEELANQYKAEKRKQAREKLGEIETPELGEYDSTFNYKKSNSEIYEYNADYIKDYTEKLEKFIDELRENRGNFTGVDLELLDKHIENLEEGLITLTAKAESFSEAAKFAEVQEDIKKLKGELAEGIFDNISNIATAAERLTNSWKTLTETMDDPDASGWEKFITIFTTIMSVIETVVGVVKAFQAVMAVAETLSLATAAAEQAGIPVKVQDAIATQAQAAAAKQLAIARHMSAAASVPYPANIAAIASTAGALAAAFAALPAFAEGGIVRGASSVGDRNLVRVNAGEAILTKMQQANLWHLLNGQGALLGKGVGGNVEFKIRGADLVGTINNYSKKISK